MDRVTARLGPWGPIKGLRIAVGAFVLAVLVSVAMVAVALVLWQRNAEDREHFALELRAGLVNSCQRNGNPLRQAVRLMLHEEIVRTANIGELHRFFPQIPRAELVRLAGARVRADEHLMAQLAPLHCGALYPRP